MTGRVLIAEASAALASSLRSLLLPAGLTVDLAHTSAEALSRSRKDPPALVLAAPSPKVVPEHLFAALKAELPSTVRVVLFPPDCEDPEGDAELCLADSYLVGPVKRGNLLPLVRALLAGRQMAARLAELAPRGESAKAPEQEGDERDFFKKHLLMELKRSKRHRYPISFLLTALDRPDELVAVRGPEEVSTVLVEVEQRIRKTLRDVDLVYPQGDQRFLVFLTHTGRDGALQVASRVRTELSELQTAPGLSASVGVAVYEPADTRATPVFRLLLQEATAALEKAQLAGGNRVEAGERVKRDRVSIG